MPGTWASGWALNDVVSVAEFAKGVGCVADSTLGVAAASFDFTTLPTTYAHLLVVAYLRGDTAAAQTNCGLRLNNDSTGTYSYETLTASSATVTSVAATAQTQIVAGQPAAASAAANIFSPVWIEIPHYANTANQKEVLSRSAYAGTPVHYTVAGHWAAVAAISRITITPGAGNWAAGSRVSIYVMGA